MSGWEIVGIVAVVWLLLDVLILAVGYRVRDYRDRRGDLS